MLYSSDDDSKLFQINPLYHKSSLYQSKGWTESTLGYIREAKQWAMCVIRNRRLMNRPYTWAVHINLNEEYPPDKISPMWKKVTRILEKHGISALWVRESNRLNKMHYHLVIKSEMTKVELERAIEEAMPSRQVVKWRKRIEPIIREWRLCHYIFKAKVKGHNRKGVLVDDLYRDKRLLFKPNMPFRKVGTIGEFWEAGKSKTKMWNEIKAVEKRIGEGLAKPNVKRLAKYVHEYIDGHIPLEKIERSFGYSAESDSVQDWIDRLLTTEWVDDDGHYS